MSSPEGTALTIDVHLQPAELRHALIEDVRRGFAAAEKTLPPVWFYDEEGSRLFEEITALPAYYLTRAERELLTAHAPDIAALAQADTLVELGAGACDKTRLLLDAMSALGPLRRYLPFDVSHEFLAAATEGLLGEYPDLLVHAVVGDFHRHLDRIPGGGRRLIAFLGSTIGNLNPPQRAGFLFDLNCTMGSTDHLLIGTDLVKDPARLLAAYDDPAGVTASFNRNVLAVLNRELGASFDPASFAHVARWDPDSQWIEMRLRSHAAQTVAIPGASVSASFAAGEELLTEISAKFTVDRVEAELAEAGFVVDTSFGAEAGEYLLTVAHPLC